jgi:hypothetical protein
VTQSRDGWSQVRKPLIRACPLMAGDEQGTLAREAVASASGDQTSFQPESE